MKKIILLEDRPRRQQDFTKDFEVALDEFKVLENVCGGNYFDEIKANIVPERITNFDSFSVIMAHRSALSHTERQLLIEYIKTTSKKLVFFSGGIASSLVQNINQGQLLSINSKDFYSKNLKLFLENSGNELLELAFGHNWKINILAELHEKLCIYKYNYIEKPISSIKIDLELNQWIMDELFKDEKQKMSKNDLNDLIEDLSKNIKLMLQ